MARSETETRSVKAGVDVMAGVIPGQPEEEFTRKWFLLSDEWHAAKDGAEQVALLSDLAGRANGYAQYLMMLPERFNWVKTEWVWF